MWPLMHCLCALVSSPLVCLMACSTELFMLPKAACLTETWITMAKLILKECPQMSDEL